MRQTARHRPWAGNRSPRARKVALLSSSAPMKLPTASSRSKGGWAVRGRMSETVIFPWVMVPVLSRQSMSTRDRFSMQNSSCTRVFFRASLMTPTARDTLVSSTSPLGIMPIKAAAVDTTAPSRE